MPDERIREQIYDLEHLKFAKDELLGTVVKVLAKIAGGEISIIVPAGSRNTTMTITDTPQQIPALTDQISWSVQNLSDVETLYLGNADVTAGRTVGGTGGWEVGPGESDNEIGANESRPYLVASAGKSILIKIRQWHK